MRVEINGKLNDSLELSSPIEVNIEVDQDQYLVSDPIYHIHGVAKELPQAVDDFRCAIVDSLHRLEEEESNLDSFLKEQLNYLRSIVVKIKE